VDVTSSRLIHIYQCFRESRCPLTVCQDIANSLDKGARIDAIIINFCPVNHIFFELGLGK
jgi:hypothetical protein